jgi:hypothetical protein
MCVYAAMIQFRHKETGATMLNPRTKHNKNIDRQNNEEWGDVENY